MSDALWVPRSTTESTSGADEVDGNFALWQAELLQETIAELEAQLWRDEDGWAALGSTSGMEWSKHSLDRIVRKARLFWLSNPLIRRGVNVRTYYTWGQGVDIEADDERHQDVLDRLTQDEDNHEELFGHQARLDSDVALQTDGNLFAALFTDQTTGDVQARTVPVEQITDKVRDPEDHRRVWLYLRQWTAETFDRNTGHRGSKPQSVYYPSVNWWPANRPDTFNGIRVRWDAPMVSVQEGALRGQTFATPVVYPALDWARAHKRFLEDWYTIVRSLSRFAWKWTGPGRKAAQAKTKLSTTVSEQDASDNNPPPPAGSAAVVPEGQDFTPIPKTGATTSVEDGRQARLMVASALEIPDTWLSGDVDVGNHATARSMDRPTELMIQNRQSLWESFYRRIFRYALDQAAMSPRGILPQPRVEHDRDDERRRVTHRVEPSLRFDWPPLQEQGAHDQVDALVSAATLAGNADAGTIPRDALARKLMATLGFDNPEELVDQLGAQATSEGPLADAVSKLAEAMEREAA